MPRKFKREVSRPLQRKFFADNDPRKIQYLIEKIAKACGKICKINEKYDLKEPGRLRIYFDMMGVRFWKPIGH